MDNNLYKILKYTHFASPPAPVVGTHYGREWLLNLSTGLAAPPSATSGDPIIFRLWAHFKHNVCAIKGNESSSRYLHSTIYTQKGADIYTHNVYTALLQQ